jgi:predicted nuclease of predicted toxin-antitoxin system
MKILADESVDREIVMRLRADGFDVASIAELAPSVSDDSVLDQANADSALLLTADKDFGELVYRLGQIHTGIVLSRLRGISAERKAEIVSEAFRNHSAEFAGAFSVISPGSIRIRRLPR